MLGSSKLLIQESLLTIGSQECRDAWIKSSRDLQKGKGTLIQVAKMVAFPFS